MTSSGQEWQFHIATRHLVVKVFQFHTAFDNTVAREWQFHTATRHTSGQKWQFHIATRHLVVRNSNFTLPLTSSGPEMAISHCY